MTDDEDFERASSYLDNGRIDKMIETEHNGRSYDELTRQEQEKAILDIFYRGLDGYKKPAKALTTGINYMRGNGDDFTEKTFTRRGKQYTFIFHGGKFFRSLK